MKRSAILATLALALALGGAAATLAAPAVGDALGTTPEAIRAALTGQGYEVRKIETEDGYTEVYAVKGGEKLEIHVDRTTGQVTGVKRDD